MAPYSKLKRKLLLIKFLAKTTKRTTTEIYFSFHDDLLPAFFLAFQFPAEDFLLISDSSVRFVLLGHSDLHNLLASGIPPSAEVSLFDTTSPPSSEVGGMELT